MVTNRKCYKWFCVSCCMGDKKNIKDFGFYCARLPRGIDANSRIALCSLKYSGVKRVTFEKDKVVRGLEDNLSKNDSYCATLEVWKRNFGKI